MARLERASGYLSGICKLAEGVVTGEVREFGGDPASVGDVAHLIREAGLTVLADSVDAGVAQHKGAIILQVTLLPDMVAKVEDCGEGLSMAGIAWGGLT